VATGIPFVLGVIVAVGILLPRLLQLRAALVEQARRAETVAREVAASRQAHDQLEQDLRFLNHFLKEFPNLTRGLHRGAKERELPGTILEVVTKSLEPERVVILVRRGSSDPRKADRLVVAAAAPESPAIKVGMEAALDEGELGFVAETQLVMARRDFAAEAAASQKTLGPETLPGFQADLVAPMVFDQDSLGIIAMSHPRRTSGDAKAALRLIAQTGAQALHNAAAYSQMKVSAEMDGLTRIFNKRHLTQKLSEMIYRAACVAYDRQDFADPAPAEPWTQAPQALSIFLFDLDHFKNYNDVNGHVAGDKLLQALARLVQENIRKEDVFGRFGGEEFLLILPNTNLRQALAAANKIRGMIAASDFPFAVGQPLGTVSVSGGVAEYPHDGLESTGLLRAADRALYEAKRSGRNRVFAADRGPQAPGSGAGTEGGVAVEPGEVRPS
jgi:diguanylate cyclase (GGDEF)-like protein